MDMLIWVVRLTEGEEGKGIGLGESQHVPPYTLPCFFSFFLLLGSKFSGKELQAWDCCTET